MSKISDLVNKSFNIDIILFNFINENKGYKEILIYFLKNKLSKRDTALGINNLIFIHNKLFPGTSEEQFMKILMNYNKAVFQNLKFFQKIFEGHSIFNFLLSLEIEKSKQYQEFSDIMKKCIEDNNICSVNIQKYL